MDLSTIEKTILEKNAKDNGWEIESNDSLEKIELFSSFFVETATISKKDSSTFSLTFSNNIDNREIKDFDLEDNHIFNFSLSEPYKLEEILRRTAELFAALPDNPLIQYNKKIAEFSDTKIEKTEAERLVKERIGQNIYREALLKYWDGKCAVTGCTLNEALRASHAKPWNACESDRERLNVYNGFLLVSNLDVLFDQGYISFTNEGLIMISSQLTSSDMKGLNLSTDMKLAKIAKEHIPFLEYHHKNIWKN